MASNRRATRRWVTLGTAVAVVSSAIPIGAASAAPATVTGGTISWGVKQSFRDYVTGPIAHGSITLGAGAVQSGAVYQFGVGGGSADAAAGSADATSSGSVHFLGHDGILEVKLSNIEVHVSGTAGTLVADVDYRAFTNTTTQNPLTSAADVPVATLDLTGAAPSGGSGSLTFSNVPASLTADGATAFGGFYPAGTALDPVSFTLALAGSGGGGDPGPDPDPDPEPVEGALAGGALRWTLSDHLWNQTSLYQCRAALEPATIVEGAWDDPDSGAVFPVSAGTYDAATGAATVELDGGLVLGNRTQGNYRIRLSDLRLSITADGSGALTADVEHSLGSGAAPADCDDTRAWTPGGDDVTIVVFSADAAGRTVVGDSTYWTATPPWFDADPANSFDQELIDSLPASLQGHFRATGNPVDPNSAANLRKVAAPISLRFDLPASGRSAEIEIVTTLVEQGGLTISVADTTVEMSPLTLSASGVRYQSTGELTGVTVTDTRATDPGWNVNAQITDFNGPAGSFPGSGLGWTPSVTSTGDGQTVTPGAAVAPGIGISGKTLAGAAAGAGRGTAVIGAGLTLHAPTTIEPGTYTATLTVTAI